LLDRLDDRLALLFDAASPYGDIHGAGRSAHSVVSDERALDFFECWLEERNKMAASGEVDT